VAFQTRATFSKGEVVARFIKEVNMVINRRFNRTGGGMLSRIKWQDILLFAVLCLPMVFGSFESRADTLFGKVVSVTDGDTITVLDSSNTQHVIRLFAVDAPETSCHIGKPSKRNDECREIGQPFGKASKKSLSQLVYGKSVNVEIQPGQTYGRSIGTVWAGPVNANLEQVRRGYAWMWRKYAKKGLLPEEYREMEEAENQAREMELGVWSVANSIPPWEYRHHKGWR